jgi:hypothetical protein
MLYDELNTIDDSEWLMAHGNDPVMCRRFVENMDIHELREELMSYWKLMHRLLWDEQNEPNDDDEPTWPITGE